MQTTINEIAEILSLLEPRKVTLIVNHGGKEREVELSSRAYAKYEIN